MNGQPIVINEQVVGVLCSEPEREHSRTPDGNRWCFHCRTRRDFDWVVYVPTDRWSYYGPRGAIKCVICRRTDSDLFPGRVREYTE